MARKTPQRARAALCAFALASLALAAPGAAQIYRWTDEQGRLHFTEHLERVPPAHRAAAKAAAEGGSADRVPYSSGGPAAPAPERRAARRALEREIRIPFTRHGSLMRVDATVNDALRIPFLIDTGASGVSVPTAYAQRLGLRVDGDTEHVQVQTANGLTARPVVTLRSVQLGGARVENLSATLNPSMSVGLLGGAFFNNFVYRVDAAESVITLEPNDALRGGHGEEEWSRRFREVRDPLERLEQHLRDNPRLRAAERETLEGHRARLRERLAELEREADRLDVPQIWRD